LALSKKSLKPPSSFVPLLFPPPPLGPFFPSRHFPKDGPPRLGRPNVFKAASLPFPPFFAPIPQVLKHFEMRPVPQKAIPNPPPLRSQEAFLPDCVPLTFPLIKYRNPPRTGLLRLVSNILNFSLILPQLFWPSLPYLRALLRCKTYCIEDLRRDEMERSPFQSRLPPFPPWWRAPTIDESRGAPSFLSLSSPCRSGCAIFRVSTGVRTNK